jgi:hypothetical protein
MHCKHTLALLLSFTLAACGGDSTSPLLPQPGVRVVSGGGGSDTILALPAEMLVVEVRDASGAPARNTTVRIQAGSSTDFADPRRAMYVCYTAYARCAEFSANSSSWSSGINAVTDDSGRARARVQYGIVAGPATVDITVPQYGYVTSATFTTRAGALTQVAVASHDTAIYVGSSYPLNATAADRFGNARPEALTFEVLTPSVVSLSGGRVSGVATGRGRIVMRTTGLVDTAFASVPPPGRLVGTGGAQGIGLNLAITALNTDGTGRRRIAVTPGNNGFANPAWTGDGARVIVLEAGGPQGSPRMFAYDTTTAARAPVVDTTEFPSNLDASYSRNVATLFFWGSTTATGWGMYKANLDGSGAQLAVQGGNGGSVSPDGTRVCYLNQASVMIVRDLSTGVETAVGSAAGTPFWSPASDLIAFMSRSNGVYDLNVVRPDGTGLRTITGDIYSTGSWSPDGQWIAILRTNVGIELVRVSDGERLRLPGTREFSQVAWRP